MIWIADVCSPSTGYRMLDKQLKGYTFGFESSDENVAMAIEGVVNATM